MSLPYSDMFNVPFLDWSGIAALVALRQNISSMNGRLKLCNIGDSVRMVLEIEKVFRDFEIYEGEDEAVDSFRSS